MRYGEVGEGGATVSGHHDPRVWCASGKVRADVEELRQHPHPEYSYIASLSSGESFSSILAMTCGKSPVLTAYFARTSGPVGIHFETEL